MANFLAPSLPEPPRRTSRETRRTRRSPWCVADTREPRGARRAKGRDAVRASEQLGRYALHALRRKSPAKSRWRWTPTSCHEVSASCAHPRSERPSILWRNGLKERGRTTPLHACGQCTGLLDRGPVRPLLLAGLERELFLFAERGPFTEPHRGAEARPWRSLLAGTTCKALSTLTPRSRGIPPRGWDKERGACRRYSRETRGARDRSTDGCAARRSCTAGTRTSLGPRSFRQGLGRVSPACSSGASFGRTGNAGPCPEGSPGGAFGGRVPGPWLASLAAETTGTAD